MEPLYIVDGSGYIFRAFFGVQPLSNSKGLPTNALFGFTRMLVKLLRDISARYIIVTFDTGEPTFRHKMYAEYKANREECPAELAPQMPYFRSIVKALGISCLEKPGFEADDIIATLSRRIASPDRPVVIVSGDKDLTQLVGENVKVWDAMRDVNFDTIGVREKFGVEPTQILDYLTLIGDSSDNVPGVRGIGPKTAQQLISHFGSLDAMLKDTSKIEQVPGLRGASGIRAKVESALEQIRLSHELISLDSHVAPFTELTDVKEFEWHGADAALAGPLFHELEFSKILDTLAYRDGHSSQLASQSVSSAAISDAASNNVDVPSFHTVTKESFADFVSALRTVKEFAFDTETTALDVRSCALVGMSFSWSDREAYYLPLSGESEPERHLDLELVKNSLAPIFADPSIKKVGLNLKFDINVLRAHGFEVNGVSFDGMLASYLLRPDVRQHGLSHLTKVHLDETMVEFKELVGKKDDIGQVEIDQVSRYACHDANASWRLKDKLFALLGERSKNGSPSLRAVFEDIEMPLVPVLAAMEWSGIRVDVPFLNQLSAEFAKELGFLEQRIYLLAGGEFNLNSPRQMSEVLFERLKLPTAGVKRTQTSFSTDASVLSKLAGEHEVVALILDYRELFKLKSTYADALARLVHPKTGRLHTSFNQAVAATGRLSSSEPNLQNIPIKGTEGRRIRRAFVADPGSVLIAADYSQIELRILAHLSGDENLRAAFVSGEDIHSRTARDLLKVEDEAGEEFDRARRAAKTINFGVVYGISAFRLGEQLRMPRGAAQKFIDDYYARYPRVKGYFADLQLQVERQGYVETLFGRRRFLRDLDTAGRDAGYAQRSLANFPIQGTAADVIKKAMIELQRELSHIDGRARMVLQVHDELVVEAPKDLDESVADLVRRVMESVVELSVPLKVDVRLSSHWGVE